MAIAAEGRLLWQPSGEQLENAAGAHVSALAEGAQGALLRRLWRAMAMVGRPSEDFWESIRQYYDVKASDLANSDLTVAAEVHSHS